MSQYDNVRARNDPKGPVHEETYTYTLKVIEEGSRHPVKEHKIILNVVLRCDSRPPHLMAHARAADSSSVDVPRRRR